MEVINMIKIAKKFFVEALNTNCRVLSMVKNGEGWKAVCEVQIDAEYTRRRGLGDMIEIYEVSINKTGEVTGYELNSTKSRASLD